MPAWSNTDAPNSKPKCNMERQTREVVQLYVGTGNTAGNNVISVVYNDGAQNNVANVGVAVGQYIYFMSGGFAVPGGTAGNGYPGFFASNTQVSTISGNTITLSTNLFNTVSVGFGVEFDKAINYGATAYANTYNQDTILVTGTRAANANSSVAPVGDLAAGWVHIQKKTNNDGTVRYLKETLVCLGNPIASNVSSGNTSFGSIVNGL